MLPSTPPYVCPVGAGGRCDATGLIGCTVTGITSGSCSCTASGDTCFSALPVYAGALLSGPYVCPNTISSGACSPTPPGDCPMPSGSDSNCLCTGATTGGPLCYAALPTYSSSVTGPYVCNSGSGCSASTIPACTAAFGGFTVSPSGGTTTTTCTCTTSTNSASTLLNCYGALASAPDSSGIIPYMCAAGTGCGAGTTMPCASGGTTASGACVCIVATPPLSKFCYGPLGTTPDPLIHMCAPAAARDVLQLRPLRAQQVLQLSPASHRFKRPILCMYYQYPRRTTSSKLLRSIGGRL